MPEPIIRTASSAARAVPRQRRQSRPALVRQLREQDWRTLVGTYRLLSRLVVERTKHHLIDDADSFARDAVLVEEGATGRCCPVAGPRRGGPVSGTPARPEPPGRAGPGSPRRSAPRP